RRLTPTCGRTATSARSRCSWAPTPPRPRRPRARAGRPPTAAGGREGRRRRTAPVSGGVTLPTPAAPFTLLASVYDAVMADVECGRGGALVLRRAAGRGAACGPARDRGCGTGNSTAPRAARGLGGEGVDARADRLAVARAKLPGTTFHRGGFASFALPR